MPFNDAFVLNGDYTDRTPHAVTQAANVSQIFVGATLAGGADDLENWLGQRDAGMTQCSGRTVRFSSRLLAQGLMPLFAGTLSNSTL